MELRKCASLLVCWSVGLEEQVDRSLRANDYIFN